jgi:DNA mismatch repair protein MutS
MASVKATPMMQQYFSIKERYPDVLLFYRMGDFYEMFFEDAQLASRVLEITLTSRNKNDDAPIPMCGVPYRAAQGYIARLIENGYKVAICDQVEDPKAAKGLVKREVVRVVTPGMIIEDELLDEKANNFILAVSRHQQVTGLASLDISTGSFRLTETAESAAIIDEIMRVAPKEILMPESLKPMPRSHCFLRMAAIMPSPSWMTASSSLRAAVNDSWTSLTPCLWKDSDVHP